MRFQVVSQLWAPIGDAGWSMENPNLTWMIWGYPYDFGNK